MALTTDPRTVQLQTCTRCGAHDDAKLCTWPSGVHQFRPTSARVAISCTSTEKRQALVGRYVRATHLEDGPRIGRVESLENTRAVLRFPGGGWCYSDSVLELVSPEQVAQEYVDGYVADCLRNGPDVLTLAQTTMPERLSELEECAANDGLIAGAAEEDAPLYDALMAAGRAITWPSLDGLLVRHTDGKLYRVSGSTTWDNTVTPPRAVVQLHSVADPTGETGGRLAYVSDLEYPVLSQEDVLAIVTCPDCGGTVSLTEDGTGADAVSCDDCAWTAPYADAVSVATGD